MNLEYDLVPTITRPTRITKTSATLIDNILVSQKFCGRFESNILIDNISNHLPTIIVLKDMYTNKKEKVQIKSRDMRPSAINVAIRHLEGVDWTDHMKNRNYDDNVSKIHQTVIETLDEFIPETIHSISYKKLRREPWLMSGIQTSTKKAKLLYKQMLKRAVTNTVLTNTKNKIKCYQKLDEMQSSVTTLKYVKTLEITLVNCGKLSMKSVVHSMIKQA